MHSIRVLLLLLFSLSVECHSGKYAGKQENSLESISSTVATVTTNDWRMENVSFDDLPSDFEKVTSDGLRTLSTIGATSISGSYSFTSSTTTGTSTPFCGEVTAERTIVDTSQAAVRISWSMKGCYSENATADIQIDQFSPTRRVLLLHIPTTSCEKVEVNFAVDYANQGQGMLDPFETYIASISKFCPNKCDCVIPRNVEKKFTAPPRALTKSVDDSSLVIPASGSYCSNEQPNGQLVVRLNASYFSHDGAPDVLGYHIIVAPSSFKNFKPLWFTSAISYSQSAVDGFQNSFYVTNRSAPLNPFLNNGGGGAACCALTKDNQRSCDSDESQSTDILIGSAACDPSGDKHCLGLLPEGQSFWVGVEAIPNKEICSTGAVYCDELLKPVYLSSIITVITTKMEITHGNRADTTAIIGGILGCMAFLAVVAGAIWFYYLRYHRPDKVGPMKAAVHIGRSRPIDLHNYKNVLPQLLRDSGFALLEEFAALCEQCPTIRGQPDLLGLKTENMRKNRYTDVLPFDVRRVTLGGDRYINASFIKGFNRQKEYIAAQGPMGEEDRRARGKYSTVDDFYEMIWQYDVLYIIMLTQLLEAGRPKCAQYWPSQVGSSVQHGIFTVHLLSEIDCGEFWTRELELKRSGQKRSVFQYHYKSWQDMTATNERNLLTFIKLVRLAANGSRASSPILVHCSAGVGRTGVFIALDILLQQIRHQSYVDIADCVYALRQQRVRMVQSEDQYVMLYRAIDVAIDDIFQSTAVGRAVDGQSNSSS